MELRTAYNKAVKHEHKEILLRADDNVSVRKPVHKRQHRHAEKIRSVKYAEDRSRSRKGFEKLYPTYV